MAQLSSASRRRFRRSRAQARLNWFLHKVGIRLLTLRGLQQVYWKLSLHHSRDPRFLQVIKKEISKMATSEQSYPWKCVCGSLNSKRALHCPMCASHWTSGVPHSNQPKEKSQSTNRPQRWVQHRDSTPSRHQSWGYADNSWEQDQWVKSPRKKSPRQRSNAGRGQAAKGGPKGKHKHAQPQMQHQTFPDPATAPGPPAVLTTYQEAPWLMAPPPPIPAVSFAPANTDASTVPHAAEARLKSMYALLEKHQEGLPPEIQKEMQEAKVQEGEVAIKSLHKQVTALGKARTELRNANAARFNLHASWRSFLVEQVAKWQAFSQQFQQQETQMAERVHNARTALDTAKSNLAASRSLLHKSDQGMDQSETVTVSDDEEDSKETKEAANSSAKKITDSLHHLGESLKTLSANADEMMEAEQQACKRQRTSESADSMGPQTASATARKPSDGSSF